MIALAMLCWSGFAGGGVARGADENAPDAHEILRTVRTAQAAQQQTLIGRLRTGAKAIPFRLVIDGTVIRYEFAEPARTLQLRLLENDSRLEEITAGGAEKVSPARFDQRVGDSDIAYEDLAMKFLYWPNAQVSGAQTMLLRKCWIVRTEPPAKGSSQYSRVDLWIDQANGALMQAEAFDAGGKIAKRFKVISGQKTGGLWILKQMRIESPSGARAQDRTPSYLEIDGVEK